MSAKTGYAGVLLKPRFVDCIASPNDQSSGSSIRLAVWNLKTGNRLPFPDGTGTNASIERASGRFSKDGKYLVVGGRGVDFVRIYTAKTRSFLKGKDYSAYSVAIDCRAIDISPNNQFVAVGSDSAINGATFHVFNFSDMSEVTLGTAWAGGSPLSIRFSPDGALCAIANAYSNYLTVYETATWTKITTGIVPTIVSYVAEFSPDGNHLVVGLSSSPYFKVYAVSNWALVKTPTGTEIPGSIIRGCAFSRDGQKMAITTDSTAPFVKVYNPKSDYALSGSQPALTGIVNARGISFNRSGNEFAVGHSSNGQLSVITRIKTSTMAVLAPRVGGATSVAEWVAYNR